MDYQRSIVYIVFFTFWVIKTIIEVYDICEKVVSLQRFFIYDKQ